MSDLHIDDGANEFARPQGDTSGTDWTGKLIKWGVVANRQQAQYVMVGIALMFFALTFFAYRALL